MTSFVAPLRASRVLSLTACALAVSACAGGVRSLPGTTNGPATSSSARHAASGAPLRVQTMAYYEGNFENTSVSASFMAANYDWTVQAANSSGAGFASAFNQAGGRHASVAISPNVRTCKNAKAGTCTDPMLVNINSLPESAWLHKSGAKKRRVFINGLQRNNTADPAFVSLWSGAFSDLFNPTAGGSAAWAPSAGGAALLQGMMWVNVPTFTGDWGPMAEVTTNQQVTAMQQGIVANTPSNVILQGVNYDYPQEGAYDALLNGIASNTTGVTNVNAFAMSLLGGKRQLGYMTSTVPIPLAWQNQQNGILDVLGRGLTDTVQMEGGSAIAHRLYGLGSFWLTYSATQSILWEDFCEPLGQPGCDSTWADATIVPTGPVQTATTSISSLASGGVYRREFTTCYQAGTAIGACVAVVNPNSDAQPMPTLTQTYTKSIALPLKPWSQGGLVKWTTTIPQTVAKHSAVILSNAT